METAIHGLDYFHWIFFLLLIWIKYTDWYS